MALEVTLENFSGPLDLLLHLIKNQEMDIYDIRIFEITEQYLAIIDRMKQLDLDIAGEFLLMAAQLIHIKSRLLLPVSEDINDDEGEDPRAELVKRLLEYQRYKQAGLLFEQLPQLDRDVFLPHSASDVFIADPVVQDIDLTVSVFQLANAFHLLLKTVQPEVFHEVIRETYSVADSIQRISQQLIKCTRMAFRDFFPEAVSRVEFVVTFLALLELIRMRMVKVEQVATFSEIWLSRLATEAQLQHLQLGEGALDYD